MFLDTSGLYALLDASESRHLAAKEAFERSHLLFTHAYVLAELVPLAQARGVPRLLALRFISTLMQTGEVEIIWVDRELHESAHQLLLSRADKTYSLCDAVSFVLMRQRGQSEALTTDHHFQQEGFLRLLP